MKRFKVVLSKVWQIGRKNFFPLSKATLFLIWDISGLRFIWYKIFPKGSVKSTNPPSTIMIWVMGIYTALWGIASQRYENRIDIIESRSNYTFAQLSTPYYKDALNRLPSLQKMLCPVRPNLLNPKSVILSILGKPIQYDHMVDLIKESIEYYKAKLDSVNLSNIDLSKTDLSGASFKNSILTNADFSYANLRNACFFNAKINRAKFRGADLSYADLRHQKWSSSRLFIFDGKKFWLREEFLNLLEARNLYNSRRYKTEIDIEKYLPILFKAPPPNPPTGVSVGAIPIPFELLVFRILKNREKYLGDVKVEIQNIEIQH